MRKMISLLLSVFLFASPVQAANRAMGKITDFDVDSSGNHYFVMSMEGGSTSLLRGEKVSYDITKTWKQLYPDLRVAVANKINIADPSLNVVSTEVVISSTLGSVMSFSNGVSRSLVTVAAAANGFQISSTRDAMVSYSVTISTASTISATDNGSVVLEICATNSSTAGDWMEIGRITNGQSLSLALVLSVVQPIAGNLVGIVPAGYYARLRSIATSGSPTFTYNSGQEVLI